MSIYTPVTSTGIYFITFTCHCWFHLIELTKAYDLVYKWFDVLSFHGHTVTGYVTMPNHLHLLLHYSAQSGKSLNAIISNGKRFLAYDIVKRLEDQREYDLLQRLSKDVGTTDRKRGKKHEIWINSFDVKHCRTESFILQKLNYIHNNPCAGRWKLAESPIEYPHSSALFYLNGKIKSYPVKDYRLFVPYDDFDV